MQEKVKHFLSDTLKLLGYDIKDIQVEEKEGVFFINIETDIESDQKNLIGKAGLNLKSIQHVLKIFLINKGASNFNIFLDVNAYRSNQEESVKKIAQEAVDRMRETGKAIALPPMSSFFRRIVHLYLTSEQFPDVSTESEGESHFRHIVIKPK